MRTALLSLALALPLPLLSLFAGTSPEVAPAQDPFPRAGQDPKPAPDDPKPPPGETPEGAPNDGPRDIFGRPLKSAAKSDKFDRLQGCWQLIDIQLEGFPESGRQGSGLMLVHEGFLAFELHLTWPAGNGGTDVHQTFISEYELEHGRVLKLNTLIGSFVDDRTGELEWERSGFAREYDLTFLDKQLIFEFGAGNRMVFAPKHSAMRLTRDIYGRVMRESVGTRDIYGRPLARSEDDPKVDDDKKNRDTGRVKRDDGER